MTTMYKPPAEDTERTKGGPAHARPRARDPRVRMALIMAPLYLITSALLAWWASDSITDHKWFLEILAGVALLLFVISVVRGAVAWRRSRH
ncbi:hypothetical protein [Streptomyces sp. NRRL F-5123]|uniref:hypothetical protein n=1 Tax=Streptomyces sp. NRRL F-5123 TaxID=1463856 RepID=UPI0004E2431B|nr:hypothetical protein [Streptomyces sp. NRRL F-5123]